MSWPAASRSSHRRAMTLFVAAELVLTLAVPFLAIAGYHALLDSRAGRFIEQLDRDQPGWRAVVEPSPLTAVVELTGGQLTGIAVVVEHDGGGTVILVPGTLIIDGRPLTARPVNEAVAALSAALRLRIRSTEVMDRSRWAAVLGDQVYPVANPDPVVDDAGAPLLAVGDIDVGVDTIEPFLGRPAPGVDPLSLLFRRQLMWEELLADPPAGVDPFNRWLDEVAGPAAQVVDLPLVERTGGPEVDGAAAEALVQEVVPIPAGSAPGDRIQVRVIDRTGTADLAAVAAQVAGTGLEVIEIGNAATFDGGPTSLVVPAGLDDPGLNRVAALTGATTVEDGDPDADPVVTLLVGSDFAIGTAEERNAEQRD